MSFDNNIDFLMNPEEIDPRPVISRAGPSSENRRGYHRLLRYTNAARKERRAKRSRARASRKRTLSCVPMNSTDNHDYMKFDDYVNTEHDVTSSEEEHKKKRLVKKIKRDAINSDTATANSGDDQVSSSTNSAFEEKPGNSKKQIDEVLERMKKGEQRRELTDYMFPKTSILKPKGIAKRKPKMNDKIMIKRMIYGDGDIRLKRTIVSERERDSILKREFQLTDDHFF